MPDERYLSVREAGAYLRVSPDWLRRSDCPRVKLGRRLVFRREDLDAFALARRTPRLAESAA